MRIQLYDKVLNFMHMIYHINEKENLCQSWYLFFKLFIEKQKLPSLGNFV